MYRKITLIAISAMALNACTTTQPIDDNYFSSPNKVVVKEVKVPSTPYPKVKASFGVGNDRLVMEAYRRYTTTGRALTVKTDGWITFPYSPNTRPLITCQPARQCVVQLEEGEKLYSINLGDSAHWSHSSFVSGEGGRAAVSVIVRPNYTDTATDLIISTNRRTYNIGLVSKEGSDPSVLRFYYPEETARQTVAMARMAQEKAQMTEVVSEVQADGTNVDLNRLSFNYRICGSNVMWKPRRIFDDSNKTFIEMPNVTSRVDLPVLYLVTNHKMQLVNYRYDAPYYVVDGLFKKAWLVSGKGRDQKRVEIINKSMPA
tara:strand:- start:1562 stop:2509 length:948 start_codon:yes stop_codon:yes gene_type:complete